MLQNFTKALLGIWASNLKPITERKCFNSICFIWCYATKNWGSTEYSRLETFKTKTSYISLCLLVRYQSQNIVIYNFNGFCYLLQNITRASQVANLFLKALSDLERPLKRLMFIPHWNNCPKTTTLAFIFSYDKSFCIFDLFMRKFI